MLLKTLLQKAIDYVDANPIDTGSLIIKIEASNMEMTVDQFINRLDVRNIGTLRAVVPQAFPKKLRAGEIEARKNIHGAWRIDHKPGETA